jgi:hypothetical protein
MDKFHKPRDYEVIIMLVINIPAQIFPDLLKYLSSIKDNWFGFKHVKNDSVS